MPTSDRPATLPTHAWVDGGIVLADSPALPVIDQAYLTGMGVFETVRAEGGAPLFFDAHHRRLADAASLFGLETPDPEKLDHAIRRLLKLQGLETARIRVTVSGSASPDGTPFRPGGPARTTVLAYPLRKGPEPPLRLITAPYRIDAGDPLAGRKCTSYAAHALAVMHARAQGGDEAVMRNIDGEITGGAASNLFWVKGGRVHTPDTRCGCRPGVTRERVIAACAELGIPCETIRAGTAHLTGADEIFATSAIRGVRAVGTLDGMEFKTTGPVTARLRETLIRAETNYARAGGGIF